MWAEVVTRLHLNLGNMVGVGGGTLAMSLTCLFCWFRGSKADRIGAAVFASSWIIGSATTCVHLWVTGDVRAPLLTDVACDVAPGLVFLWLAFRHNNLWFGAVALFQGMQSALDAADQALREPIGTLLPLILIASMNVLNLAMMAAMIGSAWSGHRRRETISAPSAGAPSRPGFPAPKSDARLDALRTSSGRHVG